MRLALQAPTTSTASTRPAQLAALVRTATLPVIDVSRETQGA
jgi:hypothetical protein